MFLVHSVYLIQKIKYLVQKRLLNYCKNNYPIVVMRFYNLLLDIYIQHSVRWAQVGDSISTCD